MRRAQARQGFVLRAFEDLAFEAFEFDADRIVIAVRAAAPRRCTGVPGAIVAAHELPQLAVASYIEMRGHLQAADGPEVGMRVPVEPVGEELLHFVAAIAAGRQADRMQHDEVDLRAGGRGPKFGERSCRAKRYQPDCQSAALSRSFIGTGAIAVVAVRRGDAQARDAIADLAQAQAEAAAAAVRLKPLSCRARMRISRSCWSR